MADAALGLRRTQAGARELELMVEINSVLTKSLLIGTYFVLRSKRKSSDKTKTL